MFPTFYWAKVTDNADPDKLHRVRVAKKGEDENVADWIPVLTPNGSGDTGLSFLPDVDDQVLVVSMGIMDGQKVVIGSVWSNDAPPPESGENSAADFNGDGENSLKFFKSRAGSMFIFDDTKGAEKMQLISSGKKSRLEFNEPDELILLETEQDINIAAKGVVSIKAEEISISSEKQMSISAEEYQIGAKKDLEISSDKDIGIKGSGISFN
jgi:phage baseplate assembly protein gpV